MTAIAFGESSTFEQEMQSVEVLTGALSEVGRTLATTIEYPLEIEVSALDLRMDSAVKYVQCGELLAASVVEINGLLPQTHSYHIGTGPTLLDLSENLSLVGVAMADSDFFEAEVRFAAILEDMDTLGLGYDKHGYSVIAAHLEALVESSKLLSDSSHPLGEFIERLSDCLLNESCSAEVQSILGFLLEYQGPVDRNCAFGFGLIDAEKKEAGLFLSAMGTSDQIAQILTYREAAEAAEEALVTVDMELDTMGLGRAIQAFAIQVDAEVLTYPETGPNGEPDDPLCESETLGGGLSKQV